jgi:hypothetical protein
VHSVFTCIHSGATAVAPYSGVLGSTLQSAEAARTGGDSWPRSAWNGYSCEGRKTRRVSASIYKSTRPSNGRMDKSALG